ncbi:MAG: ChpI protein [Acidimicrobiales bacterium]
MKTAVSIPDPLFNAADQVARRLMISRSQLYAEALSQFLLAQGDESITAQLDEIHAVEDSHVEPGLAETQASAVAEEW